MLLKMNVEMIAKKKPHSFTAKKSGRYKCVAAYPPTYYTFEQGFTQPHLTYQRQTVKRWEKDLLFIQHLHS